VGLTGQVCPLGALCWRGCLRRVMCGAGGVPPAPKATVGGFPPGSALGGASWGYWSRLLGRFSYRAGQGHNG
jgi:hypothetical protein